MSIPQRRWSFRYKDALENVYWDLHEGKDIHCKLNELFEVVLDKRIDHDINGVRGIRKVSRDQTPL